MFYNKVIVNESFTDRYTGKEYKVGEFIENLTDERVNEIKAVKNYLIAVVSREEKELETKEPKTPAKDTKKTNSPKSAKKKDEKVEEPTQKPESEETHEDGSIESVEDPGEQE